MGFLMRFNWFSALKLSGFALFFLVSIVLPLSGELQVGLQFYRETYRLNEPIPVQINVVNDSSEPVKFYISPLIYESLFFSMKTPMNEDVELLDSFQVEMKNNSSSSGDFREITLMPQEEFSRLIDLTQWFDIKESGYYYIKGLFYPNPDKKDESRESFNYKIFIKPPEVVEKQISGEEIERQAGFEKVMKLPPYDVIDDFLDAKMKKDWERFLMHIDADRLIKNFNDYYNAYQNARSGTYQLQVIEDFKKYLTVYWQDRILSYKILESHIKENDATVVAEVDFKVKLYTYTLRYTFSLYKNHLNQWLIYDYSALKVK
jgi:hypothetical protein